MIVLLINCCYCQRQALRSRITGCSRDNEYFDEYSL